MFIWCVHLLHVNVSTELHLIPMLYLSLYLSDFIYEVKPQTSGGWEIVSRLMQIISSGTGIWTQAVQIESLCFTQFIPPIIASHDWNCYVLKWSHIALYHRIYTSRSTQMWPQIADVWAHFRDWFQNYYYLWQDYYWLLLCNFRLNNLPSIQTDWNLVLHTAFPGSAPIHAHVYVYNMCVHIGDGCID